MKRMLVRQLACMNGNTHGGEEKDIELIILLFSSRNFSG
jgi:hypothetical protein